MQAARKSLPGGRWHLHHGPIDVVIGADGEPEAVAAAHEAAWERFRTVLQELVAELPALRRPVGDVCPVQGVVARRMWSACHPYRNIYITPMAAVAGSVAQELVAYYERSGVVRAWVNNGGDIALHLATGHSLRIGLLADLATVDPELPVMADGSFTVEAALQVRGVATSGWRGRSFSLGIADSVTVLASTAARADAAASMIANEVNADNPSIVRRPACEMRDDSDLGSIPVTVDVPSLDIEVVQQALRRGQARARELQARGLIHAAVLVCQRHVATTCTPPLATAPARAEPLSLPPEQPWPPI